MNDDASPDVFISYSHRDAEFVDRLTRDLCTAGLQVWRDDAQLYVGDYLLDRISNAIRSCQLFVAVVSENYLASTWCRHEVRLKLTEEASKGLVCVLPIRLDETDPEQVVPAKGWADFRDPETYAQGLDYLRVSIYYHLDPAIVREKEKKLENLLKQSYVDACYGTLSAREALARFHAAATMNPNSVFVWRALGYIYHFHIGDFESAEKHYRKALAIEPDSAPVTQALGVLFMHAQKDDLARQFLGRAAQLGYEIKDEWSDYWSMSYNGGPHSIGGIPMLFQSTQEQVEAFVKKNCGQKDRDGDGDTS